MSGTPMSRLLAAAGWDAGSIRHKQLEDALDGGSLEIVPKRSWEALERLIHAVKIYQFSPAGSVEQSHAAGDLDDAMDDAIEVAKRYEAQQ
jgi:hypothetical protein